MNENSQGRFFPLSSQVNQVKAEVSHSTPFPTPHHLPLSSPLCKILSPSPLCSVHDEEGEERWCRERGERGRECGRRESVGEEESGVLGSGVGEVHGQAFTYYVKEINCADYIISGSEELPITIFVKLCAASNSRCPNVRHVHDARGFTTGAPLVMNILHQSFHPCLSIWTGLQSQSAPILFVKPHRPLFSGSRFLTHRFISTLIRCPISFFKVTEMI